LENACIKNQLNFSELDQELNAWIEENHEPLLPKLQDFSVQQLIQYIDTTFHAKEEEDLLKVTSFLSKILTIKNENSRVNYLVKNITIEFQKLEKQLIEHCKSEELTFFPYIKKLLDVKNSKSNFSSNQISLIKNPIRVLENEHKDSLKALQEMKELTDNFHMIDGEDIYNQLMEALSTFNRNLHLHFHIENNLLFPKLLEIELVLTQKMKEKYY
jgi:regulator of cell morphogenesis and NO signaling